jgi:hypothetical protein
MIHSNTELLIDYWRGLKGVRALPRRTEVDPSGFARLAPLVFIAERRSPGDMRFRLAGERIVELHGRPMQGIDLLTLWKPEHRLPLRAALEGSLRTAEPLVLTATADGDGPPCRMEILFAPLMGERGHADRFLGLCQPLSHPSSGRVGQLAMTSIGGAPAQTRASRLHLAAVDGRRIA